MPGAPILVVDDSRVNLKGFQLAKRRPTTWRTVRRASSNLPVMAKWRRFSSARMARSWALSAKTRKRNSMRKLATESTTISEAL